MWSKQLDFRERLRGADLWYASLAVILLTASRVAVPADADAREDSEHQVDTLQTIVVTAQKREESEQKVPLAVTAIGAQELEQRGLNSVTSLMAGAVPALRIEPWAGHETVLQIAIRGFADGNGTDISVENPVPIYLDDVYNGRFFGGMLELAELDHLEVLRGPQGTLFGKNTEGGAVRIVSKAPSGELGLRETAEGGNFGYWKTSTHLDLPQMGPLAAKFDLVAQDNNGWTDNRAPGQQNFGRVSSLGGRVSLRYRPTDSLTVDYAGDWTRIRDTEDFNQDYSSTDPYNIWVPERKRASQTYFPLARPLDRQHYFGHRLTANWDISSKLTVKSITAFRHDDAWLFNTASPVASLPKIFLTGNPADIPYYITSVAPIYDITHSQVSEELQLIGTQEEVEWVGGLFFMRERGSQIETSTFGTQCLTPNNPALGFTPTGPTDPGACMALYPPFELPGQTGARIVNTNKGAFGQATYRPKMFDSKLSLTGGVRFGWDEKTATRPTGSQYDNVTYAIYHPGNGTAGDPPRLCDVGESVGCIIPSVNTLVNGVNISPGQICPCSPRELTEHRVTPMAVLAYDWTNDFSTYLRYSTGYQAPSVSLGSQTLRPERSSSVTSFELGAKSEFWQHRARLNVAAYWQRWHDPQENVQTVSASTVEFFAGPPITSRGLELDASLVPIDRLTVSLSGTYNHADQPVSTNPYPNPIAANGNAGVSVVNHIIMFPTVTGSLSLLYDVVRASYGTWRLNLDATATTPYYTVTNVDLQVPGYVLLNARFGLAGFKVGQNGGTLDLTLWARNLTDKNYLAFAYAAPGIVPGTATTAAAWGQPRTFGAALTYRY